MHRDGLLKSHSLSLEVEGNHWPGAEEEPGTRTEDLHSPPTSLQALMSHILFTASFYFDTGTWLEVAPAICSSAELIS